MVVGVKYDRLAEEDPPQVDRLDVLALKDSLAEPRAHNEPVAVCSQSPKRSSGPDPSDPCADDEAHCFTRSARFAAKTHPTRYRPVCRPTEAWGGSKADRDRARRQARTREEARTNVLDALRTVLTPDEGLAGTH